MFVYSADALYTIAFVQTSTNAFVSHGKMTLPRKSKAKLELGEFTMEKLTAGHETIQSLQQMMG